MRALRPILILGGLALVFQAAPAGPVKPQSGYIKVEPGDVAKLNPLLFKGGERACVIVEGDHDPVMDITLEVYDHQTGKLVGKDDRGGDFVSVIWYPPQDGPYRIQIKTNGSVYNNCYISIK